MTWPIAIVPKYRKLLVRQQLPATNRPQAPSPKRPRTAHRFPRKSETVSPRPDRVRFPATSRLVNSRCRPCPILHSPNCPPCHPFSSCPEGWRRVLRSPSRSVEGGGLGMGNVTPPQACWARPEIDELGPTLRSYVEGHNGDVSERVAAVVDERSSCHAARASVTVLPSVLTPTRHVATAIDGAPAWQPPASTWLDVRYAGRSFPVS